MLAFYSGRTWQLNNLELAVALAKRGNLPGGENLVKRTAFIIYHNMTMSQIGANANVLVSKRL